MKPKNFDNELYKLLDHGKLDVTTFSTGKLGMTKIVSQVRANLVMQLRSYIIRRDTEMFNAGYKKAKEEDGHTH